MLRCHLITLRFQDDRPVASDERSRLYLARLVSLVGASCRLFAWRSEGCRVRLLVGDGERPAGQIARRVEIGAQQVLGAGARFAPARIDAIEEEERLIQLHDELLLEGAQQRLLTASSLPDALGLRTLAPYAVGSLDRCTPEAVARSLPILSTRDAEWDDLPQAAAAVFGYEDLSRRSYWRHRALAAAVSLAGSELTAVALSELLAVSPSTVARAARRRPSPHLKRMILAQLRWRARLKAGAW